MLSAEICYLSLYSFITAPTVDLLSPTCLLIIYWLSPVLSRCTIFSLDSSLVSAMVEVVDCLKVWAGVFYTDNEFKQVPFLQVECGG